MFKSFICIFSLCFSKLMFVLRIGTVEGFSQCHINLNHHSSSDKAVVLQYSINNGLSWEFIALHSAMDFKQVRAVCFFHCKNVRYICIKLNNFNL